MRHAQAVYLGNADVIEKFGRLRAATGESPEEFVQRLLAQEEDRQQSPFSEDTIRAVSFGGYAPGPPAQAARPEPGLVRGLIQALFDPKRRMLK